MRTKIYLNDWFYNCGIVGFLKILEHNEKQFAVKSQTFYSLKPLYFIVLNNRAKGERLFVLENLSAPTNTPVRQGNTAIIRRGPMKNPPCVKRAGVQKAFSWFIKKT